MPALRRVSPAIERSRPAQGCRSSAAKLEFPAGWGIHQAPHPGARCAAPTGPRVPELHACSSRGVLHHPRPSAVQLPPGSASRDRVRAAPPPPPTRPGPGAQRGQGGPRRRKCLGPALPAPAPPPASPRHVWRFLPQPYKEFPSLSPAHTWRFLPGAAGRLPAGLSTAPASSPRRRDPAKEGIGGQAGLRSPSGQRRLPPRKVRGARRRHPFHLPHFSPPPEHAAPHRWTSFSR